MSSDVKRDPFLTKLALDMKGLALLYPSDSELREALRKGILESHDEQLQRVLASLSEGKTGKPGNGVALAIGQLILGSFLMVAGVAAIAPLLMGVTSPSALTNFFGEAVSHAAATPAFFPELPELVILLSVALLLSSLYALRRASVGLRDAGYDKR